MGSNDTPTLVDILKMNVQVRGNLSNYRFLSGTNLNERGDTYYALLSYDFERDTLDLKPYADLNDHQGRRVVQVKLKYHLQDKVAARMAEIR